MLSPSAMTGLLFMSRTRELEKRMKQFVISTHKVSRLFFNSFRSEVSNETTISDPLGLSENPPLS